jgi:lysozyme
MPLDPKMSVSEAGLGLIKNFEGLRLVAYLDAVGVWTIGYGCTTDVAPGMKITQAQADDRLKKDVEGAEACVNREVRVDLTQGEFDALVSFVFNLGCGAFKRSTLLELLNKNDKDAAAYEFRRWDKAGGQVLAGLTRRRYAEAKLFETA